MALASRGKSAKAVLALRKGYQHGTHGEEVKPSAPEDGCDENAKGL